MKIKSIFLFIYLLPRNFLIFLIKIYQKTLSPDHGPLKDLLPFGFCKYHPTCSQYGLEVIKKRGALIGSLKTIWRIIRCNPWSKGGYDPPK